MSFSLEKADYLLALKKSRNSIEIIKILVDERTLTHNQLCSRLQISKTNLSNVIKKLDPFNLFFIRKIGKNVYYSLNSRGYEFYLFNEEENKELAIDFKDSVVVNSKSAKEVILK